MPSARRAVVIGGGFYGCFVARFLADLDFSVVLLEAGADLLTRSSYNNQARLHGGYHYPRSFSTAYRSRLNLGRFAEEFRPAVADNFTKIYAIARHNSKVSARQFVSFCRQIDAPVFPAPEEVAKLFSSRLIEAAFKVEEFGFDAATLRAIMRKFLDAAGIRVETANAAVSVEQNTSGDFCVTDSHGRSHTADYVFNCTYSGLNQIAGIASTRHKLKHEIAELALIKPPPALDNLSVTVMDGPFFSIMPFPDRKAWTLTHVRYTPQFNWVEDDKTPSPYDLMANIELSTKFEAMIRDASRYLPALRESRYESSLYEIKTVLIKNETDDGRPILFEWDVRTPRMVSILGSKLDNIYDVLTAIREYLHEH